MIFYYIWSLLRKYEDLSSLWGSFARCHRCFLPFFISASSYKIWIYRVNTNLRYSSSIQKYELFILIMNASSPYRWWYEFVHWKTTYFQLHPFRWQRTDEYLDWNISESDWNRSRMKWSCECIAFTYFSEIQNSRFTTFHIAYNDYIRISQFQHVILLRIRPSWMKEKMAKWKQLYGALQLLSVQRM